MCIWKSYLIFNSINWDSFSNCLFAVMPFLQNGDCQSCNTTHLCRSLVKYNETCDELDYLTSKYVQSLANNLKLKRNNSELHAIINQQSAIIEMLTNRVLPAFISDDDNSEQNAILKGLVQTLATYTEKAKETQHNH